MEVSDYIVLFLSQLGVDKIYGFRGGAITHIVKIVKPITKYVKVVDRVEDVKKAFKIALSKRMRPLLIDITMDVERGDISTPENNTIVKKPLNSVYQVETSKNDQIEYYSELINNAVSPIILLGRGACGSN